MKKTFFYASLVILASCQKLSFDEKEIQANESQPVKFDAEVKSLNFASLESFKDYMNDYDTNETKVVDLYNEGFVPYRPSLLIKEENLYSALIQKKKDINQGEAPILEALAINTNQEDYDEEDYDFIISDKFASVLNAKGEIIIGDSIHRFTRFGRFSTLVSKKEILDNYISNLKEEEPVLGYTKVNEHITKFIPTREEFNKYQVVEIQNTDKPSEMYSHNVSNSPMLQAFETPTETGHYVSCHNSKSHWIDRIFGVSYECEYHFTSKRKLRTTFAVENYGVYMEVYAQAKFKHKTWFGWFSKECDAQYLKINHAALTFEDKPFGLDDNDIRNGISYYNQIKSWITPKQNTQPVVNTISTPEKKKTFLSHIDDFGNLVKKGVVLAKQTINEADFSIDFNDFFNTKTHNVVVLSIFDKEHGITNKQIMENAFKELKARGELLKGTPTGIFLMEHLPNNQVKSRNYTIYDELHHSRNTAYVRNYFRIPKKFTLNELTFGYVNPHLAMTHQNVSSKASFTYPKLTNIDLDIETGAFYDGRWGGSKLTIVYNN